MRTMKLIVTGVAIASLVASSSLVAQTATSSTSSERSVELGSRDQMEASYPQDPADEAYKAARELLNRGDYMAAGEAFRRVRERYPSSGYVAQSYYWQAFALYRHGSEGALYEALEALETLGDRYSDSAAVRDAESLEYRISGELARRGDREAAERLSREARERTEGAHGAGESRAAAQAGECPEEDDEIKVAALNALLQMNTELALPILKKVLARRDACSVKMRRKAVFLVSQHMDEETVDILLDIVKNDPDSEVREQAVFWLSQVETEEALDALEDILMGSEDRRLQEKAIFAISQHQGERSARILRDYAMSDDAPLDLRDNAIFWIGQQHSAENAQLLRDLYDATDSPELKEKVIFSLAQMGRESTEWLLAIAMDESESIDVRKKAIFWAGQAGVSIEQLSGLYDSMSDREMREQLIFALSQRQETEAVDKLLDIAKAEPDQDLRKKAIFWLSQSNDPRVAAFLLEIIEQ